MYEVCPKLGAMSTNLLHHVKLFSKRAGYNSQQLCWLHIFGSKIQVLLIEYFIIPATGFNDNPFKEKPGLNTIPQ